MATTTFPSMRPLGNRRPPPAGRIVPPARPPAQMLEKLGYFFLCVFLILMFGRPADLFFPSLHMPLVTSIGAMLVAVLTGGLVKVMRSKLGLTMAALSAWFVLVIPFSTYRGGSFTVISSMWMRSYLCFVLILAICHRPMQIRKIIHLLAWSLLGTSLLGLAYGVAPYGRLQLPAGLLTGPNELAGAMIVGILYWLFILFDPFCSRTYRAFSVVAILPIMLVLLKTGSRGGLLSLFIVLAVMFFRLPGTQKFVVTCGAFGLFLMAMLALPDDLRKRFTTYFADADAQQSEDFVDNPTGSTDSRLYLLQKSIEFTIQHPIFGIGPDQFPTYEDKVSREAGRRKGSWLGCHNTYTQISSETGLPGLFLFLAIVGMSWRSTVNVQRQANRIGTPYAITLANTAMTLRMVLIAYLIFFLFEHTAYMPFWPSLVGLIAALQNEFDLERPLLEGDNKTTPPAPAPVRLGRPQGRPLPRMA